MAKLFVERNGRIYLIGQTVSLIGDRMLWLAMGIWVKTLTGSNGAAGLTLFFFVFPSLFAPLAGTLVDRLPPRWLLLWTNLLTGAVVGCLVLVHGRGDVWLIYLVMFLYGASSIVLGSGGSVLVRTLFGDELLGEANAYLSTVQEGSRLFAPLAGAGLFTVIGGGALGLIDVGTFLVAVLSLASIRVLEGPAVPAADPHWREYTAAGARYLWRKLALRQMTLAVAVTLLVVGMAEAIGYAVVSQGLHQRPPFLGVLITVQGVGALVGALSSAPLMRRIGPGLMVALGLLVVALGSAVMTASTLVLVMPSFAIVGLALPPIIVGLNTAIQRLTPLDLQGRVDAAAQVLVSTPQTVSLAAGAALVSLVDYRLLLVVIAVVVFAAALYLGTRPQQRRAALEAVAVGVPVPAPSQVEVPLATGPGAEAVWPISQSLTSETGPAPEAVGAQLLPDRPAP